MADSLDTDSASAAPKPAPAKPAVVELERSAEPEPAVDGQAKRAAPWTISTYFAEGLPYSLVHQVGTQQYLTAMGVDLGAIGLSSLLHLPWNLKFLWSPLVDRVASPRRWLVSTQLTLALLVALLAIPAGRGEIGTVMSILVLVAIAAATNDVAIDAFYLSALGKRDQASLSGLRVAAYRGALLFGNGALVALAGWTSFQVAFLAAAGVLALLALGHALWLPSPPATQHAEGRSAAGFLLDALRSFFVQDRALWSLAFILSFRAGDALMFAMNAPLLKSLGLDTDMRGLVSGGLGTVASIAGSILGGILIAKRGLARTLVPVAAVQSLAILLYVLLAAAKPSLPIITAIVVAEQLVAGVGTAAFMVFILRRCDGAHKASHFAMATALMSLAATGAGSVSGFLADRVGFVAFFAIAFLASIPGVIVARRVPKD